MLFIRTIAAGHVVYNIVMHDDGIRTYYIVFTMIFRQIVHFVYVLHMNDCADTYFLFTSSRYPLVQKLCFHSSRVNIDGKHVQKKKKN